ncbi:DUF4998 domain-containing protein [Proteiniphilum sp.]|uniref:DUF4998 domain-containing protein n=1 Tax=Proteiniphilum sp. TaxID=1926877 RepID=UPI002B1F5705|nr:DUF4998 domain-containing protein [Proteiniphilum sp.]MEA4917215.1 DUF4998 domain-containing protein [Proteiniphilum sp.]
MKNYVFLFIALLGIGLWSCSDDDPEEIVPAIMLSTPADGASTIDLNATGEVAFSWAVVNGSVAGGYTLYLSKTADLSSPKTYTTSELSIKISSGNLDTQLSEWGIAKGEEATIYWSVKPTVEGEATLPETVRALKLKRLPEPAPVITLSTPGADGATIDLNTVEKVSFSWAVTGTITGGYTLYLSKAEDLTAPVTFTSDALSKEVTAEELDAALEEWDYPWEAEATIYWTVKPTESQIATVPDPRALKLKRLPRQGTVLGSMRNIQVRPGYERVLLAWEQNPDPLIETTVIYWNDRQNFVEVDVVRREEGWQKDSVYIPELTEDVQYTFELVNKNSSGDESSPVVASGTPYGAQRAAGLEDKTRKLRRIMMTGYTPENGARDNSPVTIGDVTLTWEAAPEGSIATKIRYKKAGNETIVYVKEPNAGTATNITEAGNRLLHPDDILYVSTLFLPDGGIDTLQSKTLQSQMVVYMVKDAPRARLNYDLPAGTWGTAAYDWELQKLFWAINQETITVLDCNRFGCFNALGGTNFLTEYFSIPPVHQFKLEIISDNKVLISGFYGKGQEDTVNPYSIYNNDQTRGEGGSSADHGVPEEDSTFDPETYTLYLNYMRIITANAPEGSKSFFIEELVPKQ